MDSFQLNAAGQHADRVLFQVELDLPELVFQRNQIAGNLACRANQLLGRVKRQASTD